MIDGVLAPLGRAAAWAESGARALPVARVVPLAAHVVEWTRYQVDPAGYRPRSGPVERRRTPPPLPQAR